MGIKYFIAVLTWFKIINGLRLLFHLLLNCMLISVPACLVGYLSCL